MAAAPMKGRVLLPQLVERDHAAFARVVATHHGRLSRVANRLLKNEADAQEVAQETFLKLWSEVDRIRDEASLAAWLTRVASNLAFDRLRQRRTLPVDHCPDRADETAASDRVLKRTMLCREIEAALDLLPGRQRLALILVHFEGMDQRTAAAALDVTREALESLLARSRRGLRKALARRWREMLDEIAEF